jgi:hypothetical protein
MNCSPSSQVLRKTSSRNSAETRSEHHPVKYGRGSRVALALPRPTPRPICNRMPRRQRALLFLPLCLLVLLVTNARTAAQTSAANRLTTPVAPGLKTTDLDLIRLLLPDATDDDDGGADATRTIDLRNLLDTEEPGSYEGKIKLAGYEKRWLRNGAHRDLCYLLNLKSAGDGSLFTWGELHVLALFRLEPRPRLLDAGEVQADRFAELWSEHSVLQIGPQKDALVIANSHFNSSEGFLQLALIAPEQDRLAVIYDYGGVEHSDACGYNFQLTPTFTTIKQARATHYPLRLRVKLELIADDTYCKPRRRCRSITRYYQTPLIWQPNKRKYVERGRGLAVIDKLERDYLNLP